MRPPQRVQVTAGVIMRQRRVLVCQRPAGGHHPLKWEFPGGKLEPGETLEACMRRELDEELGIDATVGEVLWSTHHQYPGRTPFTLTFFAIPRYAGAPTNRVFADMRWVRVESLREIDFLEGDREFVEELASGRLRSQRPG